MKLANKMWLVLLATVVASGAARALSVEEDVDVGSSYLTVPVEVDATSASYVSISGKLGGRAELVLDPNVCWFNLFGDPVLCTQMAAVLRPVWLERVDIPDPKGKGRQLYEIQGLGGPETNYLVVPRRPAEPHFLVQVHEAQNVDRVIRLE